MRLLDYLSPKMMYALLIGMALLIITEFCVILLCWRVVYLQREQIESLEKVVRIRYVPATNYAPIDDLREIDPRFQLR